MTIMTHRILVLLPRHQATSLSPRPRVPAADPAILTPSTHLGNINVKLNIQARILKLD